MIRISYATRRPATARCAVVINARPASRQASSGEEKRKRHDVVSDCHAFAECDETDAETMTGREAVKKC